VDGDRPDAVPNIVATQLTDGHPDYLQWIIHETAGAADRRATSDALRTVRAGGRWHWGHSRQGHVRRRVWRLPPCCHHAAARNRPDTECFRWSGGRRPARG